MILTWPAELPAPERNSWRAQYQDARLKRKFDAGPPSYRRRFSSVARTISLSLVLTRSQKAVFDNFHQQETHHGVVLFYMPDPTTDGWGLFDAHSQPMLTETGQPILLAARWLCTFGAETPTETVQGTEFRLSFPLTVMP